jgi:hypothetical protein
MAKPRKRTWTNSKGVQTAWIVEYPDQNGKRHLKTFKRQKDADAWLAQTKVDVKAGTHTPDRGSITVLETVDRWVEYGELVKGIRPDVTYVPPLSRLQLHQTIADCQSEALTTDGSDGLGLLR